MINTSIPNYQTLALHLGQSRLKTKDWKVYWAGNRRSLRPGIAGWRIRRGAFVKEQVRKHAGCLTTPANMVTASCQPAKPRNFTPQFLPDFHFSATEL